MPSPEPSASDEDNLDYLLKLSAMATAAITREMIRIVISEIIEFFQTEVRCIEGHCKIELVCLLSVHWVQSIKFEDDVPIDVILEFLQQLCRGEQTYLESDIH